MHITQQVLYYLVKMTKFFNFKLTMCQVFHYIYETACIKITILTIYLFD